ncbi:MAG: Asp-tRNA(Asn)/Glu-tRNA(Gln) amidotransferase subunit GatB, partial [Armatimonadetes bacterium]|nr:Asp-tRNA(Asn)/Glu-tRNA(Gln) amidotransferase subunit GatB [Armatimonadota bacterium]NIM23198.1 Asp-tRNA(Asn)/Glu-tRNA(Gln) amidotransferase subunit GatB [Armatimonadota bacterium]NIM67066.1 Asp-tRNA(Asn)/Glu-tRNA(Gln) amidotransferase subunit GatB [Armatimonadota bacterium]NIM75600.1 Asp-tRNA(Asn)/Glu-tRNA(Gln) amidotransferase subunit GatB [Armatimonadota bacterium]NIN05255.1 Asp-tRNA(Asn)/Glu-tRNA(Gln) amidotransferase subunit GatB [Armatimonadota bacterium]
MTQTATQTGYEPVVGLEVHTELDTKSKIFCKCLTDFGAPPNSQTCPVCLGMPGVLPVLNHRAVEHALRVALALECEISNPSIFERKNYYYPDLPKNYQISQRRHPLGKNGRMEIFTDGGAKSVRIVDVHLEEDAGKLLHPTSTDQYTLVDLNRAGVPLLEIISAPDLNSIAEVESYMEEMRRLLLYLEASEARMEQGQLRFEVNISMRLAGSDKLGTRVEIKNLNSFRAVTRTLEHEIRRQAKLLEAGKPVEQETRLWDDAKGVTLAMRTKEVAHDYRYFPEPDLVPLVIDEEWIARAKASLPELPAARRSRFEKEYALSASDARLLSAERALADYFEECVKAGAEPKAAANWINGRLARRMKEGNLEADQIPVTPAHLAELISLVDKGTISATAAREVFDEIFKTGKPPSEIVES